LATRLEPAQQQACNIFSTHCPFLPPTHPPTPAACLSAGAARASRASHRPPHLRASQAAHPARQARCPAAQACCCLSIAAAWGRASGIGQPATELKLGHCHRMPNPSIHQK
jgi:hypothetical protein